MSFISPIPTDSRGNEIKTGSAQELGRNDFLELLIAKLQNQDPLKPMEDEDFIAQLAQFSSLEQMNNIAEGISASNEWDFLQMQSINNTMAAGLIGKEVDCTNCHQDYNCKSNKKTKSETMDHLIPQKIYTLLRRPFLCIWDDGGLVQFCGAD